MKNGYKPMTLEVADSLNITPVIYDDRCEASYTVPFTFIKKYIPEFEYKKGMTSKCNFCKCGDEAKLPHYGIGMFSPLNTPSQT